MGGQCAQKPANHNTNSGQAPDSAARMAKLAKVEAQSALEQDESDADGDHRLQQIAKGPLWLDHAHDRPDHKTGDQH